MTRRLRSLAYLLAGACLGIAGATLLLAGWIAVGCLAITPLVVPALVAFRAATGGAAWLEARLANGLLGTRLEPPLLSPPGGGFWRRGANVVADETFWRQQAFLLQGFVLRGALAIGEVTILAAGAGAAALPVYYRWSDTEVGSWHVDSLGRALLFLPAGLAALALGVYLLGPLAALSERIASSLLAPLTPASASRRRRALLLHAAVALAVACVVVTVWGTTSGGTFWPEWVLLALGLLLGMHGALVAALDHPEWSREHRVTTPVVVEAGWVIALSLFLVGVWAAAGSATFWPVWPIVTLLSLVLAHAAFDRYAGGARRIAALEATRAGAVDAQDAELRRIERDLHDGAQARLVALGMSLGLAEQKVASDPAAARALLAEARRGAQEALVELRDLARGIHPPVLADRGLATAIRSLAHHSPLQVSVDAELTERPRPAVETAAYFVVAESLANAGKHAAASMVEVTVRREHDSLAVTVSDDGRGGADPDGAGLRGLRGRVEALDGTLAVTSPQGGPTTIEAVIPCAW